MPKRCKEWDEVLQQKLSKPSFAKGYIETALKEGLPLQYALGQVIRAMGVTEYAAKVGMKSQGLHRIIREDSNPTLETLEQLLEPLGLEITVKERKKRNQAA